MCPDHHPNCHRPRAAVSLRSARYYAPSYGATLGGGYALPSRRTYSVISLGIQYLVSIVGIICEAAVQE
jgi:hypothetical protein